MQDCCPFESTSLLSPRCTGRVSHNGCSSFFTAAVTRDWSKCLHPYKIRPLEYFPSQHMEVLLKGCKWGMYFFCPSGTEGVGLGEAGQHILEACGIQPQWHPPMQKPLWMCAGQEREGMGEQCLAALPCLNRGRSFSTLWSCQPERRGLSLKSRGFVTVTQHGVRKCTPDKICFQC